MELSQSMISETRKPWLQYSFAVSLGVAALTLSVMFNLQADGAPHGNGWLSLEFSFMMLSGLIFSFLGGIAMVKDQHKGFGVMCLLAGNALVGMAPLVFQ